MILAHSKRRYHRRHRPSVIGHRRYRSRYGAQSQKGNILLRLRLQQLPHERQLSYQKIAYGTPKSGRMHLLCILPDLAGVEADNCNPGRNMLKYNKKARQKDIL